MLDQAILLSLQDRASNETPAASGVGGGGDAAPAAVPASAPAVTTDSAPAAAPADSVTAPTESAVAATAPAESPLSAAEAAARAAELVAMGFDDAARNAAALRASGGDLEGALNLLLSGAELASTEQPA